MNFVYRKHISWMEKKSNCVINIYTEAVGGRGRKTGKQRKGKKERKKVGCKRRGGAVEWVEVSVRLPLRHPWFTIRYTLLCELYLYYSGESKASIEQETIDHRANNIV